MVLLLVLPVRAERYDLHLSNFFSDTCAGDCAQQHFGNLVRDLGLLTAPAFLAPAETLGLNGFSFGLEGSMASIQHKEDYWQLATEGDPSSILLIPRLHVRKGLPFSVEVGTQLTYLPESELFLVGAEVKWAINEGFYFIPDLALCFSLNHMLGSKDFSLTNGGWDVSVSKSFGIGGMMSLTPYAGYHMLFVHGDSHVILKERDDNGTPVLEEEVLAAVRWQDNMFNRFFVGCRLKTHIFQITAEGVFSDQDIHLFNLKLGFDY